MPLPSSSHGKAALLPWAESVGSGTPVSGWMPSRLRAVNQSFCTTSHRPPRPARRSEGALVEATATLQKLEQRLAGRRGTLETKQATLTAGRSQASDEELSSHAHELALRAIEAGASFTMLEANQGETVEVNDVRIKRLETAERNHQDRVAKLNDEITRLNIDPGQRRCRRRRST